MERFHFCFASDFLEHFPMHDFREVSLDQAAGGFVHNLLRIQSLGRLPILLTGAAIVTQSFEMLARFELGFRENDLELIMGHPSFNRDRYNEKEDLRKRKQLEWFEATRAGKAASGMTVGEVALGLMVPFGGKEAQEGIEATLAAMVTEAWTAFEVLVGRIWHAADAARPALKLSLQGVKDPVGLKSTKGMRNRYRLTFATDGAGILALIDDPRIEALALVRNILVHKSGMKDEEFITRGRKLKELGVFFSSGAPDKIQLTGPLVLELIRAIPALGLGLAIAVDEWIAAHP